MNEVVTQDHAARSILGALGGMDLPIGVMAILDDNLGAKLDKAARRMSQANGIVPPHLLDKPVTCYAVLTRALTWRLDPFAVAQSTYTVPGGKIAYEGKLVQAILENSGRIEGGIIFEHFGDWTRVEGKFKKEKSQKGGDYFVATYTEADEQGVGVRVRAKIKGEEKPREIEVLLRSCYPRNSTLWATRPKQQIIYSAVRVFANIAVPSLFMGVPFSTDTVGDAMIDITPAADAPTRPTRESFVETMTQETKQTLDETADEQSGETASEENSKEETSADSETEYSAADAFEAGRKAFAEGRALRAVPPEWRDNPACQKFVDAWVEGWKAAETDKKTAK
jgi:hypothetical protein